MSIRKYSAFTMFFVLFVILCFGFGYSVHAVQYSLSSHQVKAPVPVVPTPALVNHPNTSNGVTARFLECVRLNKGLIDCYFQIENPTRQRLDDVFSAFSVDLGDGKAPALAVSPPFAPFMGVSVASGEEVLGEDWFLVGTVNAQSRILWTPAIDGNTTVYSWHLPMV